MLNQGKYEEALSFYDKATEQNPQSAGAWLSRAQALYMLGRYNECIKSLDRALVIDPTNAAVWNNKGTVLNRIGSYNDSLECFNNAISINPAYATAWNNKGVALNNLRSYDEAIRCYNRSIELNPSDSQPWRNIGRALNNRGDHNGSIAYFDRALSMNPKDSEAWGSRGTAFLSLDRYEEAIYSFDRALELDHGDVEILQYKGYALKALGRSSEAEGSLDEARELQSSESSSGRIIVGPEGYDFNRIRAAVDSSNPGDVIEVHSGVYRENLNVYKRVTLIGVDTGGGKPVVDAGSKGSAITLSADGITLKGFNATNSGHCKCGDAGIKVRSNGNIITDNVAYMNMYGIYLDRCSDNRIYNNAFINNNISAYDNSTNYWSNEESGIMGALKSLFGFKFQGNRYSDYDEAAEGCADSNGDGICDSYMALKGGSSVDRYPVCEGLL